MIHSNLFFYDKYNQFLKNTHSINKKTPSNSKYFPLFAIFLQSQFPCHLFGIQKQMNPILDGQCSDQQHTTVILYYYNMSRCQHGQKITKFCITEHCHHKEAAGCDYCIKKYHFHLTNTTLLSEPDIEAIIKTLTFSSDNKYKSRPLQDLVGEYLRQIKQAFGSWLEQAQTIINEKLSQPLVRKEGFLPTYQRIRNRDYRKINAKDLKGIYEYSKSKQSETLKKEEISSYFSQIQWVGSILEAAENLTKEITKLPSLKEGQPLAITKNPKLNETFQSILKQKDRYQSLLRQSQKQAGLLKKENSSKIEVIKQSSLMKNRLGRELSARQKASTPNKELISDAVSKKLNTTDNGSNASALLGPNLLDPKIQVPDKYANQTAQERAKRLRRRRSSIDQDIVERKFGTGGKQKQKEKEMKELQLKKKTILQAVFSSKYSQKSQEKTQTVQGNNTAKENQLNVEFKPIKREISASYREDRSEISSNKESQGNFFEVLFPKMGFNVAELINSIIPAPPTISKASYQLETVTNKIVKIPIGNENKQVIDEIQSPIFKNKRKMEKQSGGGLGIVLNAVQNSNQQEVNIQIKESPPQQPIKAQSKEDQVFLLQRNEKNSLLLFCEALKSNSQRAIELLKAALKYSPDNLSAAQYLSFLYLQSQRAKQCLQVCESILLKLEDKPQQFEITLHLHNNRAAALNKLGRYSQAILVLEKCLKYRQKHYFYKNLADAYFSLGIPQKAAMNYEKAIRLDYDYDEAFYNLAATQFIQQEYTSAKLNIDKALKIDPQNQDYRQLLKQINTRVEHISL